MEFIEYIRSKARMTKMNSDGECTIKCEFCPLGGLNNGRELYCQKFENLYPAEAVAIIEKWVKENPVKTYLSEFLSFYPNASLYEDDLPGFCPNDLYSDVKIGCSKSMTCLECWNKPVEN